MTRIRTAFAAIGSRVMPRKDEASDAAATFIGMSLISVVAGLTVDGRGWQFAFAFLAGICAALTAIVILLPIKWGKLHREIDEIREEARELAARAHAAGYMNAMRDMNEAIAKVKAVSGGERQ